MFDILVQMADVQWTMRAMHRASALARRSNARIILLQLIPVPPTWLGDQLEYLDTLGSYRALQEYSATAEDYGAPFAIQRMQYTNLKDAIIQAAETLNVAVIYATLPEKRPNWLRRMEMRRLEKHLASQDRVFCSLEPAQSR